MSAYTPAAHIQPPMPAGITGISVGPGTLLVDEDCLYTQFAPFGVTRIGFTRFRRGLGVPCIYMPDKTKLVDLLAFQIALRSIFRPGNPNFRFPQLEGRCSERGTTVNKLDHQRTIADFKIIVSELLYARRLDYVRNTPVTKKAINRAVDRIAIALAHLIASDDVAAARAALVQSHEARSIVEPSELTEPSWEDPPPTPADGTEQAQPE